MKSKNFKLVLAGLFLIAFFGWMFFKEPMRLFSRITFETDRYSNTITPIPLIKSNEDALGWRTTERESIEENIEKFGNMALRFLPDEYVTSVEYFDVDSDDLNEEVVGLCSGGNHCPQRILIVDGDNIIFSTWGSISTKEILPSKNGNGFLVKWANDEQESQGFARPTGYVLTQFIFEDGTFAPISEQKVEYD